MESNRFMSDIRVKQVVRVSEINIYILIPEQMNEIFLFATSRWLSDAQIKH
ncbi:MAG: hypothetical protein ABI707_12465 [Ferruginibacter sp.]